MAAIEQQQDVEAEPALARAADDVSAAKVEVRELLQTERETNWTFRAVQDRIDRWSGTIVSLALLDMRKAGEIEFADDLTIRVVALNV